MLSYMYDSGIQVYEVDAQSQVTRGFFYSNHVTK